MPQIDAEIVAADKRFIVGAGGEGVDVVGVRVGKGVLGEGRDCWLLPDGFRELQFPTTCTSTCTTRSYSLLVVLHNNLSPPLLNLPKLDRLVYILC
jgi:hypothetical protein